MQSGKQKRDIMNVKREYVYCPDYSNMCKGKYEYLIMRVKVLSREMMNSNCDKK
jgi:hypothetical protein